MQQKLGHIFISERGETWLFTKISSIFICVVSEFFVFHTYNLSDYLPKTWNISGDYKRKLFSKWTSLLCCVHCFVCIVNTCSQFQSMFRGCIRNLNWIRKIKAAVGIVHKLHAHFKEEKTMMDIKKNCGTLRGESVLCDVRVAQWNCIDVAFRCYCPMKFYKFQNSINCPWRTKLSLERSKKKLCQ